jgi:hypothetical protein
MNIKNPDIVHIPGFSDFSIVGWVDVRKPNISGIVVMKKMREPVIVKG